MTLVERANGHTHRAVPRHEAHASVHGKSLLGRLNNRLAVGITKVVGSMWCAYIFAAIALVSFPAAIATRSPIIIVAWVAQTFLQLILLPIIIVGQNVQAAASDLRDDADHETLQLLHEINTRQLEILEQMSRQK